MRESLTARRRQSPHVITSHQIGYRVKVDVPSTNWCCAYSGSFRLHRKHESTSSTPSCDSCLLLFGIVLALKTSINPPHFHRCPTMSWTGRQGHASAASNPKDDGGWRYREESPISLGPCRREQHQKQVNNYPFGMFLSCRPKRVPHYQGKWPVQNEQCHMGPIHYAIADTWWHHLQP